jgi:hypothetical protein
LTALPAGYLLRWQSTFRSSDHAFTFGDQEEMGLGLRVATPLMVTKGGTIVNNEGRRNEAEVWGRRPTGASTVESWTAGKWASC